MGSLVTLDDWGPARVAASNLSNPHTFDTGAIKGRSVLVWFTHLPAGDVGPHYVTVSEVKVA